MDLSRPVDYRGFHLNDAELNGPGGRLVGCRIERVVFGGVRGVGYTEKRSQGDGRDASDVYLDSRRILMSGTIYGESHGDLRDRLQQLRSVMTPTASFTDEPGSYGYVPLSFEEPTEIVADWPTNWRTLYVNARPLISPEFTIVRDATGGDPDLGGGIPWSAGLECIDPRVYVSPSVFIDFTLNDTAHAGNLINRGDYPAPLNILLVVATQAKPGFWTLTFGGSIMVIEVPQSANTQVIRYNGTLKVLTLEELGVETLRMDLLSFTTEETHPLVLPGSSPYSWTSVWSGGGTTYMTIPMGDGSRIWYRESYA